MGVVGAIWGVYRYRRGRVFRPRCCLDVAATGSELNGRYVLHIDIIIKNPGDTKIAFPEDAEALLEILPIRADAGHGRAVWHDCPSGLSEDIFAHNDEKESGGWNLEPNEELVRSVAFNMPSDWDCCKIRLTLRAEQTKLPWRAERVVLRNSITTAPKR